jgi:hypothetical protein
MYVPFPSDSHQFQADDNFKFPSKSQFESLLFLLFCCQLKSRICQVLHLTGHTDRDGCGGQQKWFKIFPGNLFGFQFSYFSSMKNGLGSQYVASFLSL